MHFTRELSLCSVSLIIIICLGASQGISGPAPDFSTYTLVQPTLQHARTKRDLSSTRDTGGVHQPEVTVSLEMGGKRRELELRLNTELIADGHVVRYQRAGRTLEHKPTREELDLCQYWGVVRGSPGSWAAVSTCRGLRGAIYDGTHMRYIEPAHDDAIQSPHYLYSHTDLNTTYDPLHMKLHADKELNRSRVTRYKRNVEESSVHSPYNANSQSRYVELVLVADRRQFEVRGGTLRAVHSHMKDLANVINSVYAPLNIFIVLVGVVVWNEKDQIDLKGNSSDVLYNFLNYRKTKLLKKIPHDNAVLLISRYQHFSELISGQLFMRQLVVGKAKINGMCSNSYSGGLATEHTQIVGLLAATMAHELGHTFGMDHDTDDDCTCPDEQCIMGPSTASVTPTHWSSCSTKALALSLQRGLGHCLLNKPKLLFESPTCGNSFVEAGEQCDCGLVSGEEHTACTACCDPRTCMLRSNATCGAGACCDLQTCRPRAAGAVCRAAERECDLPEYCSGHSEFCPRDVFKMDSTPCGTEEQAYCVQGSCRSHSDQCRLLWGTGESSDDKCYTGNNDKGNAYGHCGADDLRQHYRPCAEVDSFCGLLQCQHVTKDLAYGKGLYSTFIRVLKISDGVTTYECHTVFVDMDWNNIDQGMVPDGAKCGHERMCLNQRCVPVSEVRNQISLRPTAVCPTTCSEHGVCNSEGHCHCEPGFAPPLCNEPGPGGSYDSGPATNPLVQRNFMVAMYVIFLGIVPAVVLALFLYYSRRHVLLCWRKLTNPSVQTHVANIGSRTTYSIKEIFTFRSHRNVTKSRQQPIFTIPEPTVRQNHCNVIIQKTVTTKPLKTINIKISIDEAKHEARHNNNVKAPRPLPPTKPKPKVLNKNKPKIDIDKQGLASSTNEILAGTNHRSNNVNKKIKMFENLDVHK